MGSREPQHEIGRIEYPLFLIPFDAGYVSVVDPDEGEGNSHYLAVFTSAGIGSQLHGGMWDRRSTGRCTTPASLHGFAACAAPVTNVAFDPEAESKTVQARWRISVQSVLDEHLVADHSPWNYPVFVIEQRGGFASIEGGTSGGEEMRAVILFTTEEKAAQYLRDAGETGVIHKLEDMPRTRDFLDSLTADTHAVALDPAVVRGARSAEHCFSLTTVLDKYLVTQRP